MTGSLMSTDYSQALCLPDNYVLVNNYPINKQVLYNIYDGTFNHPFDTVSIRQAAVFFSTTITFSVLLNDTCEIYSRFAPNIQATNVVFSNIQNNQLSIDWTDGNGSNRAVFIKQDNVGVASPSFNTTYTANTAFGLGTQIGTSGWYCVFNGTTHPSGVTVTNLLSNTTYRVMVCEYNGVVGAEQYNISSAINNPINSITQNSSCPSSFIDGRDGKTYHGIQIGNQCWMKENLNYGIKINDTQNPSNNGITEKHCYNNDENNCTIYGGLYSWMEMMQYESTPGIQGICPSGWYIPTDDEWTVLTSYLGGESIAGGKLKETGYTHWMSPNTGATNISGFSALGAGDRNYWVGGGYANLMLNERIWSSTPVNSSDSWYRNFLITNLLLGRMIMVTMDRASLFVVSRPSTIQVYQPPKQVILYSAMFNQINLHLIG
ncbi:MAG: hypothetical protein IPH45_20320 [Bacteroidales bacterium]|nr:hypothetical protein [Bacteroidales bacterium]